MSKAARQTRAEIAALEQRLKETGRTIEELRHDLGIAELRRVSAQRGLVPYVRSLEAFSLWLSTRPELRSQLEAVLRELGLWDIKLGYDPGQDVALSVVSPNRA